MGADTLPALGVSMLDSGVTGAYMFVFVGEESPVTASSCIIWSIRAAQSTLRSA